MTADHSERIAMLQAWVLPVQANDLMSEAGRKAMLRDFIEMLKHEAGSRSGDDIEDVHDMRVATRRMRSALRLLSEYYKTKTADEHRRSLQRVARALGSVRDLDVMIADLAKFQSPRGEDERVALQATIDVLAKRRESARRQLITALNKNDYARFIDNFSQFLVTPGAGAKTVDGVAPAQVRHVLPVELYQHLAAVRAYNDVLENAEDVTLHALRIEFKRLRYLITFFAEVLGSPAKEFVTHLKTIQDHLGRLQDIAVAEGVLSDVLDDLNSAESEALRGYLAWLEADARRLRATFPEVWKHFNSKGVQRLLANAVSGL